jgi:hypothetical protein
MFIDLVGDVDTLYAMISTTSSHGYDIPMGFKILAVKARLQHLELQLAAFCQPTLPTNPLASQLSTLIKSAYVALHVGQRWVEDFSKLVD